MSLISAGSISLDSTFKVECILCMQSENKGQSAITRPIHRSDETYCRGEKDSVTRFSRPGALLISQIHIFPNYPLVK